MDLRRIAVLFMLPAFVLTAKNSTAVAEAAYDFLYPLVIMNATMSMFFSKFSLLGHSFMSYNRLFNNPVQMPASSHAVVRPNVDTLYGSAYLDLPGSTMVCFDVPDAHGRYYVAQFMDMWTNTFQSIGARTTGLGKGRFWVVGPEYTGQTNASMFRSPTRNAWLLLRIMFNGFHDYPHVWKLQHGFTLEQSTAHPISIMTSDEIRHEKAKTTPPVFVASLDAPAFFSYAAQVMSAGNMPAARDRPIIADMASIGIIPGEPFNWTALSTVTQACLRSAVAHEKMRIEHGEVSIHDVVVDGWRYSASDHGNYSTDYEYRAEVARSGLGANVVQDALYLNSASSIDAIKAHTLRFEAGSLPPVHGFWSLTVYGSDFYLVPNKEKRYALGDRSMMQTGDDGSTTIYLHSVAAPNGIFPQSNWLPTPSNGTYSLTLMMYWPANAALNGHWRAPPIKLLADVEAPMSVIV